MRERGNPARSGWVGEGLRGHYRPVGVKLFQIEEPDGSPTDPDAPGAAIGIDLGGAEAEVAVSVGGNAVVLADREGFEQSLAVPGLEAAAEQWEEVFIGARLRAERALARPATHAVIAVAAAVGASAAARLTRAAGQAGLAVLRLVGAAELRSGIPCVLAAALLAEDLAPPPEPGVEPGADLA